MNSKKVIKNFIVHVWQIPGYVKVNTYLRKVIRKKLKNKYGSLRKAEIKCGIREYHQRKLHKKFTRIDILVKLINICKISKYNVEKQILRWIPYTKKISKQFKIKFPVKVNPLHFRIAAHIIGDGTISTIDGYKCFTWSQKETKSMEQLQKQLFGTNFKKRRDKITIPSTAVQLVSNVLEIPIERFNKERFLKECLSLPKEYRLQILTAIIEDEGSFDKNRLLIRMADKNTMDLICCLIDMLNYDRTELRKYVEKSKYSGKNINMYRTEINIRGLKRFNKDLGKTKQKYGNLAVLWTKYEKLEKISKSYTLMDTYDKHNELIPKIRERFLKRRKILFSEIKTTFNLTDNQTMSLLRCMKNKGLIKRIRKGTYIQNEASKNSSTLL